MVDVEQAARRATGSSATAWTASASSPRRTRSPTAAPARRARVDRRRLRRPQGPPVPGLRPLRVRRPGRHDRRQLRPLPRARRGDASSRCASSTSALEQIPDGPVMVDDPRVALPPKSETYNTIEAMIRHFKHHHGRHPRAARRGVRVRRGRQRRARLLHRRPTAPAARTSAACARPASCDLSMLAKVLPRPVHRRHRADLRHDQHDRRGVRPLMTDTIRPDRRRRRRRDGHRHDRRQVGHQFPKGTNVLEAARTLGVDIRAFCYHPGLSSPRSLPAVPGRRQGTAEAGAVLLHAGRRRDGGHDHRSPQSTLDARQQMLEFTLLNHPIDCPICDKAGECTLQKLYFDHDNADSRVDVHEGPEAQGRRPRPAHRARSGALHPVHALHPRLRRGRRRRTSSRWPTAATTRC